jgi:hypothetical protein
MACAVLFAVGAPAATAGDSGTESGEAKPTTCEAAAGKGTNHEGSDDATSSDSCAQPKPKPSKRALRLAKRAAAAKALARAGEGAELDGVKCKKAGRGRFMCYAFGWKADAADEAATTSGEEAAADDVVEEEDLSGTEFKAKLVVRVTKGEDGKLRARARILKFKFFGDQMESCTGGGEETSARMGDADGAETPS